MKIAIVDYGMGNLGSVSRVLAELGTQPVITDRPEKLVEAARIILPGVGSFADGMTRLAELDWIGEIRRHVIENGKPLLGICLGMQMLATRGTEGGDTAGLGLIPGEVVRLDTLGCNLRIPHVGWNSAALMTGLCDLFAGIPNGTDFYFVHSFTFLAEAGEDVLAYTDYGIPVVAAISRGHVFGTQFHPEKSSK